jgi:murein DD-endopeptidase MepM/ murein hydrolase activator NlpD
VRILFLCVGLTLFVACAAIIPSSSSVSVEQVIRASAAVGQQLDGEALEACDLEPASKKEFSFQSPLRKMKVNSPFGQRSGHRHEGVDLKADKGTPIYAAQQGIVVLADDSIYGYGDTVIVRHAGGYSTLYAHASKLRVRKGDRVKKGDCIAYAGRTGNARGAHLHFEVREGTKPVNPARWLSPRQIATKP